MFSLADYALAKRLGVTLDYPPICHSLACGCQCEDCKAIREQPQPPAPRQDWFEQMLVIPVEEED